MSEHKRTIIELSPPKVQTVPTHGFTIRVPSTYAPKAELYLQRKSFLPIGNNRARSNSTPWNNNNSNENNNNNMGGSPLGQSIAYPPGVDEVQHLVEGLDNPNLEMKLAYLLKVVQLTSIASNHYKLVYLGIVQKLVDLICVEEEVLSSYAILSLNNLSIRSDNNQRLIGRTEIFPKLNALLRNTMSHQLISNLLMLLTNLSCCDDLIGEILSAGLISSIIMSFNILPDSVCYSSLLMIQNTIQNNQVKKTVTSDEELQAFLKMLLKYTSDDRILNASSVIFSSLSYEDEYCNQLIDSGYLPVLVYQFRSSDNNIETLRHSIVTLTNFSALQKNQQIIFESGLVSLVIQKIGEIEDYEFLEHAIMVLSNLSQNNLQISNYICDIGIENITNIFHNLNETILTRVAKLLFNLSQYDAPRYKINNSKLLKLLQQREHIANNNLSYYSKSTLKRLTIKSEYKPTFQHAENTISAEKAEKNRLHRIRVIQEVLDTERTYVGHLIAVNQFYMKPLREIADQGKPLITDTQYKEIFSSLEVLWNMHTAFLQSLERISANTLSGEEISIGDVFLELVACLKLYRNYISNYDKAVETLSDALENKKFKQFVDLQQSTYSTLGISSILITPIQRIPRYSLLLQDLIKHMTEEHPDFMKVNEALSGVLIVADYLDEEKGKNEAINKVISIQENIDNLPFKLVEPHRFFVKEGEVVSHPTKKTKHHLHYNYFYLFCDLLLIAKRSGSKFRSKKIYYLNDLKVVELPDDPNSFRIITQDDGFSFSVATSADRNEWVKCFNDAIYEQKKNSVQRRVASHRLSASSNN